MQAERSHHPSLSPAEREMEDALRELNPSASRIDRDRLLFDAGAAVGRARMGRLVGSAAGVLVAGLAFTLLWRPEAKVVERVVYLPAPPAQRDIDTQVADGKRLAAATAPVVIASLTPMPFPVPGGPFVTVPRGLVGKMGMESGAIPTAAYIEKIQNVLSNGWTAAPSDSDRSDDALDTSGAPEDESHRS